MYPTLGWRIENATIAAIGGAIACALLLVVLTILWRRGADLPRLLVIFGSLLVNLGLSTGSVIRLIGLRQGADTLLLALDTEFGGTLGGLVLLVAALVIRRRRAAAR